MNSRVRGGSWFALALLLPAALPFVAVVLVPALQSIYVSLETWTGYTPDASYVGLRNFVDLAHDEKFWRSYATTVAYMVLGGVAHFFFAFCFLAALTHPRFPAKTVLQSIVVVPSFVSVVGVALIWQRLYHPSQGLLNRLLDSLGFARVSWLSEDTGLVALVAASVWAGVGSQLLLLIAGARTIPESFYEAARIEGASEWQVFRYVTVPCIHDVTAVALALWIIGGMQVFGLVQALAGPTVPEYLETISTYQYAISFNARDAVYLMGKGTAMAVVLVASILALLSLGAVMRRRTAVDRDPSAAAR